MLLPFIHLCFFLQPRPRSASSSKKQCSSAAFSCPGRSLARLTVPSRSTKSNTTKRWVGHRTFKYHFCLIARTNEMRMRLKSGPSHHLLLPLLQYPTSPTQICNFSHSFCQQTPKQNRCFSWLDSKMAKRASGHCYFQGSDVSEKHV